VLGAIKIYQNISREKRRQRAESREQRAESREQRAESREQRAEQTNIFLGLSRGGITQW
jgi:hypothetical protein